MVKYPLFECFYSSDESPSGSGSGSGSEDVNKRCEETEVKILISAYKDHQENINNSKSSKGQKSVWERIFDTFTEHCKTAGFGSLREICFTLGNHYSRITAGTTVY